MKTIALEVDFDSLFKPTKLGSLGLNVGWRGSYKRTSPLLAFPYRFVTELASWFQRVCFGGFFINGNVEP